MTDFAAKRRIAVIRDFREEGWPSMDLSADMLLSNWPATDGEPTAHNVEARFEMATKHLPIFSRTKLSMNVDRLWNRFVVLPRQIAKLRHSYHAFHIVDHSYAHLVHSLPAGLTGVYCHDLDAFQCLLRPEENSRPWWFRRMTQQILRGLSQAAIVFHNTHTTANLLLEYGLTKPRRLRYAPLGVAAEYLTCGALTPGLPPTTIGDTCYVLHVGSCIRRKRIDVLLDVFAQARKELPELHLVKVGDPWTSEQQKQITNLQIEPAIRHLGKVSRDELAKLYRFAAGVLVTSEAEGFGLPVIEALACGTAVIASDLPSLREAGGNAACYAPVADIRLWTSEVIRTAMRPSMPEERGRRRTWAARFSWQNHACTIREAYRELLGEDKHSVSSDAPIPNASRRR